MPPIINKDLKTIHEELARSLGDLVGKGTIATPTASQISTQDLVQQRSDQLKGQHIYFYSGGGVQQDRDITAFTPYSVAGGYAIAQVLRPWSPVPSTNTQFFVHKRWSGQQYNDAITQAVRRVMRRQLTAKFDRSIVLDSRLLNSKFEKWSNGTISAPDDWTLNGTGASVAQETGIVYPNTLYGAKLTNQANEEAYLSQSVADYPNFTGKTFSVKVLAYTTSGTRVRVRVTDGVNTWNSDYHNGFGLRTLEILDRTITETLEDLQVQLRIESGVSIDAYFLKVTFEVDGHVYEYPLSTWPSGFVYVDSVWVEDDKQGVFNRKLPDDYWYIDRASKKLALLRHMFTPEAGKVVEVRGQAYPREPSAETDAIDADNEYVLRRAGVTLIESLPWGSADSEGLRERYFAWRDEAERMERMMTTRARPNARVVEDL